MSEVADPTRWQREWSPRKARICPKCRKRQFGDLEWVCLEHGIAEDQEDRPYMGSYPKTVEPALTGLAGGFDHQAPKPPDGVTYGAGKERGGKE